MTDVLETDQMPTSLIGPDGRHDANASEPSVERVVGQVDGLATADRFLDDLRQGSSSLVIAGEAGTGKTTLWRAIVASALGRRYRVLSARPAESESQLAFAALGDLLVETLPLAAAHLPEPQARALRVAMLLEDASRRPPDQRAVSIATLNQLRSLAGDGPLVVAIDDTQWLDAPTARVLEFAGRRLGREPIGLVAVRRLSKQTETASPAGDLGWSGEAVLVTPAPLDPGELGELIRARLGATFGRALLAQIATGSGGNPLFALEIARAIDRAELTARPGQPLHLPATLEQMVRGRLDALQPDVSDLLLMASAAADPTVELLTTAIEGRASADLFDAALRSGVIEIARERVQFTHPLYASTIYHAAPIDRRRRAHRRLAEVAAGVDERALHLSLAAEGPDAAVADALERAAREAAERGAPDAAANLIDQAVASTPAGAPDAQRRRLVGAGYHFACGNTRRARDVLEALASTSPPGALRADILRRLAAVRYRHDSCSAAAALLTRALEEDDVDVTLLARIHRDLGWAITQCGDVPGASAHARTALALATDRGAREILPEVLAANGLVEFLLGAGFPEEAIRRAVELERPGSEVPIEWQPGMMLALMLKWSGDLPAALTQLGALHAAAVDAGDEASLPFLLAQISEANTWAGAWRAALSAAEEAHLLAAQTDQAPMVATALYARALVRTHLGDVTAARKDAREGLELSERVGSVLSMMLNQSVLGHLELSVGNPAGAHEWLGPLVQWLEVVGIREPGVLRFVPDEVEALVSLGTLDRADALLIPYESDASRLGRPWARLAAARSRALLTAASGHVAPAADALAASLDELGQLVPPFERARSHLVLGTVLRRTRRRREARAVLQTALELFDELRASVWSARTRALLGSHEDRDPAGGRPTLTPTEERVAELVAEGCTNREAAARLFISVRAVEVHLTSIYRKLRVSSRTGLVARLAAGRADTPTTPAKVRARHSSRRQPTGPVAAALARRDGTDPAKGGIDDRESLRG